MEPKIISLDAQKHCILVAASNPHPLPTPVYCPPITGTEHIEKAEVQTETCLVDAETVAKSFGLIILEFVHSCWLDAPCST